MRAVAAIPGRALLCLAGALLLGGPVFAVACGVATADDLVGTWSRVDDDAFVLTIDEGAGGGYEVRFENTAGGESQTVAGSGRSDGTIQAAFEIPAESTGALTAGVPDVVSIKLSLDGDVLVVTTDGAGGRQPVELWRYEREGG